MTEDLQNICAGVCKYNETTEYICCAHFDKPAEKRISQHQCEADHSMYGVIIHGTQAKRNEFPFMAAIGWRALFGTNKISYKCGGVLISRKYVLTAAHCLYHSDEPPIVVRPGGFDLNDTEAEDIEIDQIFEHPGYKHPSVYNDIAILGLKDEYYAKSFDNTAPACPWALPLHAANVTAIGYGNTQFAGLSSSVLMKTNLTIVSNRECTQYYETDGIIYSQICASDPVRLSDTCQGDSGGPLILYRNLTEYHYEVPYVVGLTSFGIGCGTGTPGVYTRVASYIDWIEKIVYF
ncbi:serine protease snake-like [Ceratitis capitata]|uniref:serine protease snake-like n=1 Tax=Ceratitis capitata TaxID=7213 RepID=UPI00061885A7|nr:serine protease snake-like [Ceratitis capitata]